MHPAFVNSWLDFTFHIKLYIGSIYAAIYEEFMYKKKSLNNHYNLEG
jgi:hypothetical protein